MEKITNWKTVSDMSRENRMPIIVMVDQEDCPFCTRVEEEFFSAIFASKEWESKALFGKISLDSWETIAIETNTTIPTRTFLKNYKADFTPTILFLDSEANELVESMIGLSTPDYYLFYLEQSISKAYQQLNS